MQKKAVILFSGGLDSTTCIALAQERGFECFALSLDYGGRQQVELTKAKQLTQQLGIAHKIIPVGLNLIGGSALTDNEIAVHDFKESQAIPNTYVPARNTVFLSIALGWAEVLGAYDIFIGANILDYSGYPDCRPEYLEAFEKLADLATRAGMEGKHFKVHAPLLKLNKAEIIREGIRLGIDYSQTMTCYRPDQDGKACGNCDSCTFRKKGFEEAGIQDPTHYF